MGVALTDEPNKFKWIVTSSGVSSIKSMYAYFMNDHIGYLWNTYKN
jgi:hypothetical protein